MKKKKNRIVLIEPFLTGSHQRWAQGLKRHSQHEIEILSLPGRHWKWRMQGAAFYLAQNFNESEYDAILATDMLDLATFKGLAGTRLPMGLYFHENQLTYPWSKTDPDVKLGRDLSYALINFKSALCAQQIYFNSMYHKESFYQALDKMLRAFPDCQLVDQLEVLYDRSSVLSLGMEFNDFDSLPSPEKEKVPLILWNHRWEYDKNPNLFFETLFRLKDSGVAFKLAVLGEHYRQTPDVFDKAREYLKDEIIQFGMVENFDEYGYWLKKADILPVTSYQDFFGMSVVEAIYCKTLPLLPKRLAYPEHICGDQYFYENEEEFEAKLRTLCQNFTFDENLSTDIDRYRWEKMITTYDHQLNLLSCHHE